MRRRRIGLVLAGCLGMLLMAAPAMALFTNGGFETGDFTGWTVEYGTQTYGGGYAGTNWGTVRTDQPMADVVANADALGTGIPYRPAVYQGTYMAQMNNITGMYHATRISQTDTIDAADLAAGGFIWVNWGAVLNNPGHDDANQPAFQVDVLKNGANVGHFFATAPNTLAEQAGWTSVGGSNWYKNDAWSFDMTSFALGDSVSILLSVYDCGYSGHGGYAFLDGIAVGGPHGVPEPGTLMLLGTGIVGLVGIARRKRV